MEHSPLKLKSVSMNSVDNMNGILQRYGAIIDIEKYVGWELEVGNISNSKADISGMEYKISIRFAGSLLDLYINKSLLDDLFIYSSESQYIEIDDGKLPDDVYIAMLDNIIDDIGFELAALNLGEPKLVKVSDLELNKHHKYNLSLNIRFNRIYPILLTIDEKGLAIISSLLRSVDKNLVPIKYFNDIAVVANFILGITNITFADFKKLKVGDLVFIDKTKINNQKNEILVKANKYYFEAKLSDRSITVTRALYLCLNEEDEMSSEEFINDLDEVAVDEIELSNEEELNINLKMEFDIGSISITLNQLRNLRTGHTIDLDKPLDRFVNIRVNNKKIGTGSLVDIDGHLGISISSIDIKGKSK